MRPIATNVYVAWSVCLSVCGHMSTRMNCAKTAKPIEMPFVRQIRVGTRNYVLDGGPDPHGKGNFRGGMCRSTVTYPPRANVPAQQMLNFYWPMGATLTRVRKGNWLTAVAYNVCLCMGATV